ncbi:MAG: hypothetical protein F9K29_22725 [Hyphomicrobiaceae bacterium]|nr:MAG: hypothetical protein F9K29_22725 [Hyphomicrobiaceae bacterium]
MSRDPYSPLHPAPDFAGPERLVGLGFRYWLAGFRTGDISCWERAWCAYSNALGAAAAKGALTDLSCWVRAINRHAQRDLETAAVDCDRFCRDECVAIAMIAACQHNACPAMRACAFSLLGCSMIDEVVQGAENFAATMRGADQVLLPSFAHGAPLLAMAPATPTRQ